jgi:uncharacterized protein
MASKSGSIDSFLAQPALAIVGVSRWGKGFGNVAMRELRAKGYRVYPIHPLADEIKTEKFYQCFAHLPEPVTAALVVLPPEQVIDIAHEAVAAGVRCLWLQQGAESTQAIDCCRKLGLEVIAGECILMFAKPEGVHKLHRWIRGVFGGLPRAEAGPQAA